MSRAGAEHVNPRMMTVVVVGGVAAGSVLRMRADAQFVELSAPDYIKPLATPDRNAAPEVVKMRDQYEVHPIAIKDTGATASKLLGVAVVKGMSLSEAFAELITAYGEKIVAEAVRSGRMKSH